MYFLAKIFAKLKATRQACEVPQLGMGSVNGAVGSRVEGGLGHPTTWGMRRGQLLLIAHCKTKASS